MTQRILLTGTTGQLGFELQRALAPLGEVVSMRRGECDLADAAQLRRVVRELRPAVIVNPAAYTAVDKAESVPEAAFAINAQAPAVLAEEARALGALLVHYSTDYVFDGSKAGPYTEDDAPNPQGVYGRSKLQGEQAVVASGARHLVFRTSWVLGAHGGNFAKTMLRLAAERDRLGVVADQFGAPTSASLIADVTALLVRQAMQQPAAFPYGLYHLVNSGETHWHAYACHVIEAARAAGRPVRVAAESIQAIGTADYPTPAKRPANSRLDTRKLRETFGLHLPSWQSSVDHILQQIFD